MASDVNSSGSSETVMRPGEERVVYVLPADSVSYSAGQPIDLWKLWDAVYSRLFLIMAVTALSAAGGVAYALLAPEWFRAEVLLAPTEERDVPSLGRELGGLAMLVGLNIDGSSDSSEAIATLQSRDFARSFIEDYSLLPVFFAKKWDAEDQRWRGADPRRWPDLRDAVEYFHEEVLRVSKDRNSSMVTLAITWKDPEAAAEWSRILVDRLNELMRMRALEKAENNVAFLRKELETAQLVVLQESIGRLLEVEMNKLMLARGNEDFAFRVIDGPEVPKRRARPLRSLVVVGATIVGGALSVAAVVLLYLFRVRRQQTATE